MKVFFFQNLLEEIEEPDIVVPIDKDNVDGVVVNALLKSNKLLKG